MSLKKRLLAVFVIICTLAGVVFVGFRGMTIPKMEQESIFHKKDAIYFWYTDDSLTDYINSAAVTFGEENDIRVIPVLKSGMEYLEAVNQASLTDEEALPDVYLLSNDSLEKAYLAGLAAEVDDNGVCSVEHFPQAALSAVTYHDKLIAYPYYFETSAYLYNKTYLEDFVKAQIQAEQDRAEGEAAQAASTDMDVKDPDEEAQSAKEDAATADTTSDASTGADDGASDETAEEVSEEIDPAWQAEIDRRLQELLPETTEELLTFADSYEAPETVDSILKWDVSDIFYNYYFIGKYMVVGGEAGDNTEQIDIYNLEAIQCLKVYQKLNQFFYIDPDTVTYDSVLQDFIDGKVVFSVVTNDAVARLEQAKEEGSFTYEYGVMNVPRISETLKGRSLSVTNAVVVNGYSQKKELANRFAAFLTTEYLDNLYDRTGKTAASYDVIYENPSLESFRAEYATSIPMPKMIETSNFWIQLEILFSKVWSGDNINDLVRALSEQMMTQVLGEPFTEEYIEEPEEETQEEGEYVDDGEVITEDDVIDQ